MISNVAWKLIPETGQLTARMEDPTRDLVIAFDGGDQTLYLSVHVPPPPNVQGVEPRLYTAPLSVLAALTMLPQELHKHVVATVEQARTAMEGVVLGHVQDVVAAAPQPWPTTARALGALDSGRDAMAHLERLSLDAAALRAYEASA